MLKDGEEDQETLEDNLNMNNTAEEYLGNKDTTWLKAQKVIKPEVSDSLIRTRLITDQPTIVTDYHHLVQCVTVAVVCSMEV